MHSYLTEATLEVEAEDFTFCLDYWIDLWNEGKRVELLLEGRSIQQTLLTIRSSIQQEFKLVPSFSKLMLQGKTKATIHLTTENNNGWVSLPGNLVYAENADSHAVFKSLRSKHPPSQPCAIDTIGSPRFPSPTVQLVIFEGLNVQCIWSAALQTTGACGPSPTDAHCWRRLCCSFKTSSNDLWHSLVLVAKKLCLTSVNPVRLSAFLACCLIPLSKLSSQSFHWTKINLTLLYVLFWFTCADIIQLPAFVVCAFI